MNNHIIIDALLHSSSYQFKKSSFDSRREELRVSLQALRSLNSRRQLNDRSTGEYNVRTPAVPTRDTDENDEDADDRPRETRSLAYRRASFLF